MFVVHCSSDLLTIWHHKFYFGYNSAVKMVKAHSFLTNVLITASVSLIVFVSILVNGLVLAVIARFKSLRTIPNILIANHALVDILSVITNSTLFVVGIVWKASWFRGWTLAIINSSVNRLFLMLNLVSRLAMMTNMYLAISFGFRYLAWKTKTKALVCVFLIWLICISMVILLALPLLHIDLGDAHITEYRVEIFRKARYLLASSTFFFIICDAVVCFLTARVIKRERKKVWEGSCQNKHKSS